MSGGPGLIELELRAAVTIDGDALELDFAGTARQHDGNLNCPLAVTRSACYFVVRCLTAPDLPASGMDRREYLGRAVGRFESYGDEALAEF